MLLWNCDSQLNSLSNPRYDASTRLFDTRCGSFVRRWEEPFDEAIYCLSTDNNMTLVCGTARHGLVRLWDMRASAPVQMFYTAHAHRGQSSPAYSVAFDQSNLYVALDQCLNLLGRSTPQCFFLGTNLFCDKNSSKQFPGLQHIIQGDCAAVVV